MPLDLYCERLGPGLLAEPINAIANAAFFAAAFAAWRLARRQRVLTAEVGLLIVLLAAIGVGSTLFHTFATSLTKLLDILPILLFQLAYLWIYCHRIAGFSIAAATGAMFAFLIIALPTLLLDDVLNGSLMYAPALLTVFAIGVYHRMSNRNGRNDLLCAAGLFLVSVTFRTMDLLVCSIIPIGTHFLWHLLNGMLLYLALRGLLRNLARVR